MNNKIEKIMNNSKEILFITISFFFVFATIFVFIFTLNKMEQSSYIGQEFEARNTITITGKGKVFVKPDLALVNLAVITEAKSVELAMLENKEKMNNIISFMKENKIEEKDLQTVAFRVNPRYEWHEDENPLTSRRNRVLVGYEINQSLEVKIRDMDKIGDIIQGGATFGANQIGSLHFTVDNKDEIEKEAREKAIKQAKEKAKALSKSLGIKIDKIVRFEEGRHSSPWATRDGALGLESVSMLSKSPAMGVEVGENETQVIVHITYEIK